MLDSAYWQSTFCSICGSDEVSYLCATVVLRKHLILLTTTPNPALSIWLLSMRYSVNTAPNVEVDLINRDMPAFDTLNRSIAARLSLLEAMIGPELLRSALSAA